MRTVKLVVIGASGVGKTSLRNQYISGRFTTGYRATIGADFITKTLPHHSFSDESVVLQIWDTAGQERFSSLSSAFFRGADAALLMFDVNQPQTLDALHKWWSEFRERAPVPDDELEDFCCVVVGNKIDMLQNADGVRAAGVVSEADALALINELVPPASAPPSPLIVEPELEEDLLTPNGHAVPLDIAPSTQRLRRHISKSRSRSRSLFRGGTVGTMTTTHTVYHTPSSSFFDAFESALSSPVRTTDSFASSPSLSPSHRTPSASSISSVPTITPSLFVRRQAATCATTPLSGSPPTSCMPPPPRERRPKLFFTSAKTGEGVAEVFEYVARRVVVQREHEEALEARTLHMQDADDIIRLTHSSGDHKWAPASCCGS
ncbi:ras-domain-containing protein [Sparassis crispa]|uniref:Ras-domain-containing protein n=1 Tax=Sparassis crispa TaxID=139825 RepID=A0A401G8Z8_9APHY|nr:ras-domain-containing protein [Sparassis crispa]GBE78644.1 ras-domain-containing protein [Sparassis crispa]